MQLVCSFILCLPKCTQRYVYEAYNCTMGNGDVAFLKHKGNMCSLSGRCTIKATAAGNGVINSGCVVPR